MYSFCDVLPFDDGWTKKRGAAQVTQTVPRPATEVAGPPRSRVGGSGRATRRGRRERAIPYPRDGVGFYAIRFSFLRIVLGVRYPGSHNSIEGASQSGLPHVLAGSMVRNDLTQI